MSLFGFGKDTSPKTMVSKDIVAYYQCLRPIRFRLNNEIVHRLSRDMLSAQRRLAKLHASKTVTNRRCSCGSGKMFKNCCGKR